MNTLFEGEHTVGKSKWDLDTPALCVDVDALERNLRTMQCRLAQNNIACRPHAKTHKCPAIAALQMASGAVGICAAKVSEAEVFAAHGIDRILLTTANHTPVKIRRAMAIRTSNPQFIQAIDFAQTARDLRGSRHRDASTDETHSGMAGRVFRDGWSRPSIAAGCLLPMR